MEAIVVGIIGLAIITCFALALFLQEIDKKLKKILHELESINGLITQSDGNRMQDSNKTASTSST